MHCRHTTGVRVFAFAVACIAVVYSSSPRACAQGNVVLALDGMIVNYTNWGRFSYDTNITVGPSETLGRYGAFTISEPGTAGSGVGINFTIGNINSPVDAGLAVSPVTAAMFPILDRATFGANFDPSQYVAELVYKPLPGNLATQLNLTLDSTDGFTDAGLRAGEQWQWNFLDLVNTYNNAQAGGQLDADGFATVRNNMGNLSQAAAGFNGQSYMYTQQPLPADQRDMVPDFNDFEGGPLPVPNGVVQIHLQTVYGDQAALDDAWEVKAVRVVKLNPDPREVARLDGHSGFSQRFGPGFQNTTPVNVGGTEYIPPNTDQLSRFNQNGFTNIVVNTADNTDFGGFGIWQSAASTVFDGTDATMEIRAKLTAPLGAGQADVIQLVVKDKDGNDTGEAGDFGGEEYHFDVDLNQFNTSAMTTISLRLEDARLEDASEFTTPGDEMLTNFNLYYLGVVTNAGEGLVDLEIESIRVLLPEPAGVTGDFNNNGVVDAADYVQWRNGGTLANEGGVTPGTSTPEDYNTWRANFGRIAGGGAASGQAAAVPEPSACLLCGLALGMLAARLCQRR